MENSLSKKLEGLLIKLREKKFKEQLLELTIVRDCVAHPNFYIVKDIWKRDDSWGKSSATFPSGVKHGDKATKRKRERSERTKILGLPMVSTWISYRDVVMCLIVVSRFLHLLERKYGNPYAHVGRLFVQDTPDGAFKDVENKSRRIVSFDEWTRAFYNSLSPNDQKVVGKRLGHSTLKRGLGKDTSSSYANGNLDKHRYNVG